MGHISFRHLLMTVIQWEKTDTIQNTETLLDVSKEVGFKVKSEETKYMLVSHKKAGKKCIIRFCQQQRIFRLTSCPDQLWGPHSLLSHGYQWGLSPGVKRGWSMMLITHTYLGLMLRISRSYTSPPTSASLACSGTANSNT
jgi:hypothetical protein